MKNIESSRWYLRVDGATHGPFSRVKLLGLASQGRLPASAMIRQKCHRAWYPAAQLLAPNSRPKKSFCHREADVFRIGGYLNMRTATAILVILASPLLGLLTGPVVGLGVFESYVLGPACGFVLVGSILRPSLPANFRKTRFNLGDTAGVDLLGLQAAQPSPHSRSSLLPNL